MCSFGFLRAAGLIREQVSVEAIWSCFLLFTVGAKGDLDTMANAVALSACVGDGAGEHGRRDQWEELGVALNFFIFRLHPRSFRSPCTGAHLSQAA